MSRDNGLIEIDRLLTKVSHDWHDARKANDKPSATYLNGKRNGLLIAISLINGEFKADDWTATEEGEEY